MADTTYDIPYVDAILRGEIAAVETYNLTIEKFKGDTISSDLIRIRDEHKAHVAALSEHIRQFGGTPSTSSGVWGAFTNMFTAGAKLIGPETALAALKQGEQHGLEQYEKALERKDLPAETVSAIRAKLLPESQAHLTQLDHLMEKAKAKA